MVPGVADGIAETSAPTFLQNAAGKAGLTFSGAGSGTLTRINLGLAAAYNLNVAQHEFIFCVWSKEPVANFSTGQNTLAGKQAAANDAMYNINVGNGGISQAITTTNLTPPTNAGLGAPRHLGLHWKNGQQRLYVNGVLAASSASTTALPDHSAYPLFIGSSYTPFYRLLLEDIAVSRADPAAQIVAYYARGVVRFA